MPKKRDRSNKRKAFRMRLQGMTQKAIATELKVSPNTIARWEKGWIDSKGRKHKGWLSELQKLKEAEEKEEYHAGLALKRERMKAYDELAQMAIAKIKEMFPNIKGKTATDAKALLSEVRELCRLIAMEQGELGPSSQTIVAVKNDITIEELSERYRNAGGAEALPEPEE
jgi:transcriptional regulator with XRE-family HTH domain